MVTAGKSEPNLPYSKEQLNNGRIITKALLMFGPQPAHQGCAIVETCFQPLFILAITFGWLGQRPIRPNANWLTGPEVQPAN